MKIFEVAKDPLINDIANMVWDLNNGFTDMVVLHIRDFSYDAGSEANLAQSILELQPEFPELLNKHKAGIIASMLKLFRNSVRDAENVLKPVLIVLQYLNIDWPELQTIKTSLENINESTDQEIEKIINLLDQLEGINIWNSLDHMNFNKIRITADPSINKWWLSRRYELGQAIAKEIEFTPISDLVDEIRKIGLAIPDEEISRGIESMDRQITQELELLDVNGKIIKLLKIIADLMSIDAEPNWRLDTSDLEEKKHDIIKGLLSIVKNQNTYNLKDVISIIQVLKTWGVQWPELDVIAQSLSIQPVRESKFTSKQQVIDYFVKRGKPASQGAAAWERGWRGPTVKIPKSTTNKPRTDWQHRWEKQNEQALGESKKKSKTKKPKTIIDGAVKTLMAKGRSEDEAIADLKKEIDGKFYDLNENYNGYVLQVFNKTNKQELGQIVFESLGDKQVKTSITSIDRKFRGQGIGRSMYDFMESNGYKIVKKNKQSDLPPPENARKTQIAGTLPTYTKGKSFLDKTIPDGPTLDFGAGLGLGAASIGADTYEPYPRDTFQPTYSQADKIPDNSYAKITNFNVLNVVPKNIRDDIVSNIGRILKPGGVAVITTRGKDVLTAKGRPGPEPMSIITSIGTYQKGFTRRELVNYVSDVLGQGYEVSAINLGPAGVLVKKLG